MQKSVILFVTSILLFTFITGQPSAEDAKKFIASVNAKLDELMYTTELANWNFATNITKETEAAAVQANLMYQKYMSQAVLNASQYTSIPDLDYDTKRMLNLLKVSNTVPPLQDPQQAEEIAKILAEMEGFYSSATFEGKNLDDFSKIIATSKDYDELEKAWLGWRSAISAEGKMKNWYKEFVRLSNIGAQGIGYNNTAELWTSGYDMDNELFIKLADSLWEEVKPLYEQLHCYARAKLGEKYGNDKVTQTGMIPAHLLGNMWAQSWANIYDILVPYKDAPSSNSTQGIIDKGWTPVDMVKFAEGFFTRLGLPAFNPEFYQKSMFERPPDREVVCHASAWDLNRLNNGNPILDTRIKMCIEKDHENLIVIHHESGHINYYLNYANLQPLYRSGANDGFHEAIGDTIALSITPGYLKEAGLIKEVQDSKEFQINQLMIKALEKVAFLPFGLLIDKWRWNVFSGEIPPEKYNEEWWKLVNHYQGIKPPKARTEDDFDPGAKYHIPANTPYMRYFLAAILQFQFHEALCKEAGHTGPLYNCTINGSQQAGKKFREMLELGASKPWQDALMLVTGTRNMSGASMMNYFEPLMEWLKEQNKNRKCGWESKKMTTTTLILVIVGSVIAGVGIIFVCGVGLYCIALSPNDRKYEEITDSSPGDLEANKETNVSTSPQDVTTYGTDNSKE